MHDCLGVAARVEAVPGGFEILPELAEVVDLAVEHDPDRFILVVDRLMPGCQIDDAEARMAQANAGLDAEARAVGSAMPDGGHHPLQQLGLRVPGLSGSVFLERGTYLHLGMSLKYAAGEGRAAYDLTEIRRVKFYDKNYYDHPAFGVIAVVTPAGGARAPGR